MKTKNINCDYCEQTGIIHDPHFMVNGESPLSPCPKCVIPKCVCGGESPYYFIKDRQMMECHCRESRMRIDRVKKIYKTSNIEKKYQWKFFNDFEIRNDFAKKAKNAAYDIVSNFPDVSKGLFLWGNPGTGKTLLSSIILTELIIKTGVNGSFLKISRNYFRRIKDTFTEGSSTYGQSSLIEQELAEIDLLIVDDFGVNRGTEWEKETLYNLVDSRYEAEKFTIFTANANPRNEYKDIADQRILSRIKEMCKIMELSGEDFRDKL